jgi:dockerin type I repeat protein
MYPVEAQAEGFLRAVGSATIASGGITAMPTITLLGGDINGDNVIDRFDAMTIGMNYNAKVPAAGVPSAADLNNDGIINVLDLELLAKNYQMTGPVVWQ